MSTRTSRRRRAKSSNALGAILIAVAFAALISLAGAAFYFRPPPTNPDSLCRTDIPLAAHTIILIDATDKLERRHRERLRAVAAQERARLTQYDRLTILRVDARHPREPAPLFSKCLPKPPERANILFENPHRIAAQWDADFAKALDSAIRRAAAGRGQSASPIVSAIRAAAANPDFGEEIPARRLVIVSDLLEHDPEGFSLYAPDADYALWSASNPQGPPDLTGVGIRLSPLDRTDHSAAQTKALADFWPRFFEESGAAPVSIDPNY